MTVRLTWALLVVIGGSFLAVLASVGFAVRQQHDADQRWCDLMTVIVVPESSVPKSLPKDQYDRQIKAVRAINKLSRDLGCD